MQYHTHDERYFTEDELRAITKIVDIGDWNMDSSNQKDVSHGLTQDQIISVTGWIRRDDDAYRYMIPTFNSGSGECELGVRYWTDTVVRLQRRVGGLFDDPNWDATSFNRGQLYIKYIP